MNKAVLTAAVLNLKYIKAFLIWSPASRHPLHPFALVQAGHRRKDPSYDHNAIILLTGHLWITNWHMMACCAKTKRARQQHSNNSFLILVRGRVELWCFPIFALLRCSPNTLKGDQNKQVKLTHNGGFVTNNESESLRNRRLINPTS